MRACWLLPPFVAFLLASPSPAGPPDADGLKLFESRIRPLLVEQCITCHGPKKQKGDLRLDSAAGMAKGGDSGKPLFDKAAPERGMLIQAVRHLGDVPKMPPKGKLTDAQLADLARWVALGASYPAETKVVEDPAKHWAFKPPTMPVLPDVRNAGWVRTPVDRFILAKLEAKNLAPVAPADKRTLIRRATFDLIGLPPTPAEVDAFLADNSPDAFARVIDRLLASPHYGEKWGRHWLDVARYADSNGLDENVAHGNAWRYRDYVIAAFNADKPYDQFLREQIAGDLLPAKDEAARRERLIATGFLSLGPKVLAEVDERKMELDIVDEQLDTLGRAALGLTLGCARCHDHKFDPISQDDYYGLAGVFLSTTTMDSFKKVARWHENPIGTPDDLKRKADHDKKLADAKARLKAAKPDEMMKVKAEVAALEKSALEVPSAMSVSEGKPIDAPLMRRGNHLNPGKVVPRRFPTVLSRDKPLSLTGSGRLELARWLTDPANPLTARVIVNRVWRWHFGQGLVRSVDNFGLLGEKPTHPELLDFLAVRFIESGWSVEQLHRSIMLSAAYQTGSTASQAAVEADPGNRLLSRFPLRRLEAEEVRDSLLAVSGLLDRTVGGPALAHVKNRDYLFDHTSTDLTRYDVPRRSVYLPVIRNNLYDVFQLFDAPDPSVGSGDRTATTVATQALFWMNGDLVAKAADALMVKLLVAKELDDAGRVRRLYEVAYGRPATDSEVARAKDAVTKFEADLKGREADAAKRRAKAWGIFAHAVLATNEFAYVR